MLKVKVLRAAAVGATGLILLGSTAAYAHGFGGPGGFFFGGNDEASLDVDNDADVDVHNDIDQDARSGDAKVEADDDRGCHFFWCDDSDDAVLGDATTGDAGNTASQSTSVTVTQGGACDCLDGLEGDFDDVSLDVDNDADVDVHNDIDQDADSGDARVEGGSGNATTGDASNSATQSTTVVISQG